MTQRKLKDQTTPYDLVTVGKKNSLFTGKKPSSEPGSETAAICYKRLGIRFHWLWLYFMHFTQSWLAYLWPESSINQSRVHDLIQFEWKWFHWSNINLGKKQISFSHRTKFTCIVNEGAAMTGAMLEVGHILRALFTFEWLPNQLNKSKDRFLKR